MSRYCSECGKLSNLCGEHINAPCVAVEQEFEEISSLHQKDNKGRTKLVCTDLDTVIGDLYEIAEKINDDLQEFKENTNIEIEQIKDNIDALEDICNFLDKDITECELDLSNLIVNDECGNPITITTLKELLQKLIDNA